MSLPQCCLQKRWRTWRVTLHILWCSIQSHFIMKLPQGPVNQSSRGMYVRGGETLCTYCFNQYIFYASFVLPPPNPLSISPHQLHANSGMQDTHGYMRTFWFFWVFVIVMGINSGLEGGGHSEGGVSMPAFPWAMGSWYVRLLLLEEDVSKLYYVNFNCRRIQKGPYIRVMILAFALIIGIWICLCPIVII